MKSKRRIAVVAAAAVVGAGALWMGNAAYGPTIAKAGGLGDFYKYKICHPYNRSFLTGKLSNYDAGNFTKQRYHHGANVFVKWHLATPPLYNDESWPITKGEIWDAVGYSGTSYDGTQDFQISSTTHTVTFIWTNGSESAHCSIKE